MGPRGATGAIGIRAQTPEAGGVDKYIGGHLERVRGRVLIAAIAGVELGLGEDLAQVGGEKGARWEIPGSEETTTGVRDGGDLDCKQVE